MDLCPITVSSFSPNEAVGSSFQGAPLVGRMSPRLICQEFQWVYSGRSLECIKEKGRPLWGLWVLRLGGLYQV